ncbi:MAG: OPT/YSL family transporter, partial [Halobacteriales archaeon]|nr:OPT/YSL family transporter [Halobacteriales archaeon]
MAAARVEPFSPAFWAGLNSGTLERQLDAQGRAQPARSWDRRRVALGVLVGLGFALVNQYVGLRTGLIVFGSWYVVFLAGLALRWGPAETNLAAVASSGANFIVGGYAYVLPALFLGGAAVSPMLLAAGVVGTALAGILGSLAFAAFRQAWLVDEPLPYPSFEQYVQLLALTQPRAEHAQDARRAGKHVGLGALGAGLFAFARDVPLGGQALLAPLERTGWYSAGAGLQQPLATAQLTWLNLALSPLLVAVGWFMRVRTALVIVAGACFAWLLAAPLAVLLTPGLGAAAAQGQPAAVLAFQGPVRAVAAGAILGGGLAGLARLAPKLRALRAPPPGAYDLPLRPTALAAAGLVAALAALLTLSGAPVAAALLVGVLVTVGIVVLGAVAVKAAGETSLEPASGAGFVMALALALALSPFGLPLPLLSALVLVGAASFFAGVTMMGNLLLDLKVALYVGNPPRDMLRAALLGIVPGALLGGVVMLALAPAVASGAVDFPAPQARAYAALVGLSAQGQLPLLLLGFGIAVGAFAEWRTKLGAAFAIGLPLPIGIPLAMLLGSGLRAAWERGMARSTRTTE